MWALGIVDRLNAAKRSNCSSVMFFTSLNRSWKTKVQIWQTFGLHRYPLRLHPRVQFHFLRHRFPLPLYNSFSHENRPNHTKRCLFLLHRYLPSINRWTQRSAQLNTKNNLRGVGSAADDLSCSVVFCRGWFDSEFEKRTRVLENGSITRLSTSLRAVMQSRLSLVPCTCTGHNFLHLLQTPVHFESSRTNCNSRVLVSWTVLVVGLSSNYDMDKLSSEKLKTFTSGVVVKNSLQKQKEAAEAKRRVLV